MRYAAIAELRARHPFYRDGRCRGLSFEPTAETESLLRAHRALVRSAPDGLSIVAPFEEDEAFLPFAEGEKAVFRIRIADDDLPLFTDLADILALPFPRFTDEALPARAGGALALVDRPPEVPPKGPPPVRDPAVLADLEIGLSSPPPGPTFSVTFPPQRRRWAYYVLVDRREIASELTIVDTGPADAEGPIVFGPAGRADLLDSPDPTDAVAREAARRWPGMPLVRFVSDMPVACREEPRTLELRLGATKVWSPLPNPSLRRRAGREGPAPPPRTEEVLYHVLQYRSQPFP